jgi:hypothetical protein
MVVFPPTRRKGNVRDPPRPRKPKRPTNPADAGTGAGNAGTSRDGPQFDQLPDQLLGPSSSSSVAATASGAAIAAATMPAVM